MKRTLFFQALLSALLALSCALPPRADSQTTQRAIVLAWDGTVPSFVRELLKEGKLPNLAKLIEGGAFADDVVAGYPSKTAAGFASLMTGAPPRVTGISGNRVPRAPRAAHTILESIAGFSGAPLRAEAVWATAQQTGKKSVVSHMPTFAEERSEKVARFSGYDLIAGRDGIVTKRAIQPATAATWENPPASETAPIEVAFTVGDTQFAGLLIDDPEDLKIGYDTLIVSTSRDGKNIRARLKPANPGPGGELFWSAPLSLRSGGEQARSYFRLFDLKADGSDFFLYYTRPTRELDLPADIDASPTVRTFIGNGATILYQHGGFGRTIANGGSGSAEARYLETMQFAQHQLMETNRWAIESLPWELYLAYTPFPDEAEHAWRGYLDQTLPTYRQEIADKLRPLLEQVYRSCDDHLGLLLSKRPSDAIFALISDHGVQGIYKRVALNHALQQAELLVLDGQGRVDLTKTKVLYPAVNNGYLLINSSDRKSGIVPPAERAELVRKVSDALLALRDGDRPVVTAIVDAAIDGEAKGIGGEVGGDVYLDLAAGYDFDPRLTGTALISDAEPYGTHGANPAQPSMRTLMVLNGPGIRTGTKIDNVRIIDFAPTLAWLLNIAKPKDATGRVLYEAFTEPR